MCIRDSLQLTPEELAAKALSVDSSQDSAHIAQENEVFVEAAKKILDVMAVFLGLAWRWAL
eukprot:15152342-Alexandrium_andersonii.AAC.1